MRANEFITEEAKAAKYNGLLMKYAFNDNALVLKAFDPTKTPIAYVKFVKEHKELYPQDLWTHDDFRNRGIAKSMYDFLKNEGYVINRSHDQTKAGAGFWDKHRGEDEYVWEEINADIRNPEFYHEQEISKYKYTAKTELSSSGLTTYLHIRCYDGAKLIGKVNFEVRNLVGKKWLESQQTEVAPEYKKQGIASTMYAYAKMLGNDIKPSPYQSDEGQDMWKAWNKSGDAKHLANEEITDEMALKQFTPMGDFNKPGPFSGVDKRLVTHPTNQLKTAKFFEKTPYDFRLFFSNIPGTGKYSETGPVNAQQLQQMFGDEIASQILVDSDDAITVVFVGNKGDSKVMMTPWIMAHRIGHAIQAGERRGDRNGTWRAAEQHFFSGINNLLADFYGKKAVNQFPSSEFNTKQQAEYNALFNAIGTQRSSRAGQIKRPYEFMYELFAQYLGTGNITLKPLPKQQDYGRKAWGRSTQSLNMRGDMQEEAYTTEILARDMELMFDDVLSSLVGKVLVM